MRFSSTRRMSISCAAFLPAISGAPFRFAFQLAYMMTQDWAARKLDSEYPLKNLANSRSIL
jgi:hypothetical protein